MQFQRKWLLPVAGMMALTLAFSACTAPTPPAGGGSGSGTGAGTGQGAGTGGGGGAGTGPGTGSGSGGQAEKKIKRGGELVYSQPASYAGADPAMGQNAYQLWYMVGTYMLRREADTWKLVGDAIEKWDWSPDGTELTLKVRQGVKWQNKPPVNGRDVEAKDIVYTLKSITGLQYPDLPPLRFPRKSNLDEMKDAVAVDKYTVKVTLNTPSSTFLDGLSEYRSPITPDGIREHFGGRDSLANPHPDRYLSAGPFILTKFQDTVEAVYERYPDYWEKGEDGQSKPYLDRVRNIWITDQGTEIAAFLAGQTSYTGAVSNPEARAQIAQQKPNTQMIQYEPQSCWYRLAWNMTRKPFDDARVRRALSLVLDPVESGQTLFGEWQGKPVWRYPGNLPWSFPEAYTQEEMAKLVWYESPKSQKTIDEAKKLIADAGLAGGFEFEMISSSSATTRDGAQLAINQITRIFPNIKIKASPIDNAIQLERAAKGDFDAQYYCYIHEPTAVAMMKTVYHSKGGRNTARLNDSKMDDLLDRAGRELDESKRRALLREAQDRSFEVNSIMGAAYYAAMIAFQPEVRDFRVGGATIHAMFTKDVWLDK